MSDWVEIPIPHGAVQDGAGNVLPYVPVTYKIKGTNTHVTHAADDTGASPTTGSLIVRPDGTIGTLAGRRRVQSGQTLVASATVNGVTQTWEVPVIAASVETSVAALQDASVNYLPNGQLEAWADNADAVAIPVSTAVSARQELADGWFINTLGTPGAFAMNVTPRAFTPGQTGVPGNPLRWGKFACSNAGTLTNIYFEHRFDDAKLFSGEAIIVSFWARATDAADAAGTSAAVTVNVKQYFGTGGSAQVQHISSSKTIVGSTTWAKHEFAVTLGSVAGKTFVEGGALEPFLGVSINFPVTAFSVDIASLRLERGATSSTARLSPRVEGVDIDPDLPGAFRITAQGRAPFRVPPADKMIWPLTSEWRGSQPSDVGGHLQDALHRSATIGGRVEPGEGYFEVSSPIMWEESAQLHGVGTFQNTVIRGGAIIRGYVADSLTAMPPTDALGGGETWLALKSGSNCPLIMHDFDNSEGLRGPAWGDSYAIHGVLKGVVLDHNGRNNTGATCCVDMRDAAMFGFDDVRVCNPYALGVLLSNCNDVHGDGIYGIGLTNSVANGVGDVLSGSPTISNATGTWVKGDFIQGTGIPAGAYLRNVVGATLTLSANATATNAGTALTSVVQLAVNHLKLTNHTTDCWWTKCSMHSVSGASVLFEEDARGNVVQGFFGYGTHPGANNARFTTRAAHNQLYGRLDQCRGHNARLDSTTHDNTLWVACFGAGQWNSAVDADAGWVNVFDDGMSNASYGTGAKGWGVVASDIGAIGVHRFGPLASGHGVNGMGGGSDLAAGSEKHRNLGAGSSAARSCVMPGPQPWSVPGTAFLPVSGSAAVVAAHAGNSRLNVLKFDRTTEQAAGYHFTVPHGCTGLVVSFEVLNQDATKSGDTYWDVEYSDYPYNGGNTPGAAEQSWSADFAGAFFGKAIAANNQSHSVLHPTRATAMFATVPGDSAVVHIRRKAALAGDTLDAEVGLWLVRFEPVMLV